MHKNLRNISAWIVAELLIFFGFVKYAKRKVFEGNYILSIYFHNPSKAEFESCVKWLKKNNFKLLSISELDQIINKELPFPKGAVILTVDDGWQSNLANIAPIVDAYHIPITIFITTNPVEDGVFWWSYWLNNGTYNKKTKIHIEKLKQLKNTERLKEVSIKKKEKTLSREALTIDEVIELSRSKYITIGSHTHYHSILPRCNDVEAHEEIFISTEKLSSWIKKKINYFAYPNGDFSVREINILKNLNFRLAFTTDASYLTPERLKDKYNIPRFSFIEGVSFAENICRMVGIWKFTRHNKKHDFLID